MRDEAGRLQRRSQLSHLENWSGSVYHPWERWLMSRPRCQAVFPRDSLTTETLQKWSTFSRRFPQGAALTSSIPAFDLGNPMMDRLEPRTATQLFYSSDAWLEQAHLTITLLPGSRSPEAYANWQQILVEWQVCATPSMSAHLLFLGAIAPSLSLESLRQSLVNAGFQQVVAQGLSDIHVVKQTILVDRTLQEFPDPDALTFSYRNALLVLSQHGYNECLHFGDLAIASGWDGNRTISGIG